MECPKCSHHNVKYKQKRPGKVAGKYPDGSKSWTRTDHTIVCPKCGEFDEHGV